MPFSSDILLPRFLCLPGMYEVNSQKRPLHHQTKKSLAHTGVELFLCSLSFLKSAHVAGSFEAFPLRTNSIILNAFIGLTL